MKVQGLRFKDGVIVIAACLDPEPVKLLSTVLACAPETADGFVWVTEAFRPARHPRDLHTSGRAFDVRIHNLLGATHGARLSIANAWVARCRAALADRRYQFEIHGATLPQYHIHAEFDAK